MMPGTAYGRKIISRAKGALRAFGVSSISANSSARPSMVGMTMRP